MVVVGTVGFGVVGCGVGVTVDEATEVPLVVVGGGPSVVAEVPSCVVVGPVLLGVGGPEPGVV